MNNKTPRFTLPIRFAFKLYFIIILAVVLLFITYKLPASQLIRKRCQECCPSADVLLRIRRTLWVIREHPPTHSPYLGVLAIEKRCFNIKISACLINDRFMRRLVRAIMRTSESHNFPIYRSR